MVTAVQMRTRLTFSGTRLDVNRTQDGSAVQMCLGLHSQVVEISSSCQNIWFSESASELIDGQRHPVSVSGS